MGGCLEKWATVVVTREYNECDIVGMVQGQRDSIVGSGDSEGEEALMDTMPYTDAAFALDIAQHSISHVKRHIVHTTLAWNCFRGKISSL